jgi:hypothetical protein
MFPLHSRPHEPERLPLSGSVLISAALKAAKHAKAPALEVYPLDRNLTPSTTSTGISSTFERAGFKTVVRRVPPRPIMRHDLKVMPCLRWPFRT